MWLRTERKEPRKKRGRGGDLQREILTQCLASVAPILASTHLRAARVPDCTWLALGVWRPHQGRALYHAHVSAGKEVPSSRSLKNHCYPQESPQ